MPAHAVSSAASRQLLLLLLLVVATSSSLALVPQPGPLVFTDLSLTDLNAGTVALESPYALVASAKEAYGMAEVHDGDVTCSPLLVRITDRASLQADVQRPQVILSGEIHGDERVVWDRALSHFWRVVSVLSPTLRFPLTLSSPSLWVSPSLIWMSPGPASDALHVAAAGVERLVRGAPLARLEGPYCPRIQTHQRPRRPAHRCAFGPPGNAVSSSVGPRIQAHQRPNPP